MHWPQETQGESPKGALKRAADVRGEAALVGADHTHGLASFAAATQRRHRMHLLSSRTICGAESSMA